MTFGGKAQYARFWRTLLLRTEATCFGKRLSLPDDNANWAPEWTTWGGPSFIPSYACLPSAAWTRLMHIEARTNGEAGVVSLSIG
jgi:hypothetical protein